MEEHHYLKTKLIIIINGKGFKKMESVIKRLIFLDSLNEFDISDVVNELSIFFYKHYVMM